MRPRDYSSASEWPHNCCTTSAAWLPVVYRVQCKLFLMHAIANNEAPAYLQEIVQQMCEITSRYNLRPSVNSTYVKSRTRTKFAEKSLPTLTGKVISGVVLRLRKSVIIWRLYGQKFAAYFWATRYVHATFASFKTNTDTLFFKIKTSEKFQKRLKCWLKTFKVRSTELHLIGLFFVNLLGLCCIQFNAFVKRMITIMCSWKAVIKETLSFIIFLCNSGNMPVLYPANHDVHIGPMHDTAIGPMLRSNHFNNVK